MLVSPSREIKSGYREMVGGKQCLERRGRGKRDEEFGRVNREPLKC